MWPLLTLTQIFSAANTVLTTLNKLIVAGTVVYFDEITGWKSLSNNMSRTIETKF